MAGYIETSKSTEWETPQMSKSVTIKQVLDWTPCNRYTEEVIAELFIGRKSLTMQDIAELDIPTEDKVWALLHEEFFTERQLHELACAFAERTGEAARVAWAAAWAARVVGEAAWTAGVAAGVAAEEAEREWQLEYILKTESEVA